jgi:hypothetical protein
VAQQRVFEASQAEDATFTYVAVNVMNVTTVRVSSSGGGGWSVLLGTSIGEIQETYADQASAKSAAQTWVARIEAAR